MTKDRDPAVRIAAADAIGRLGSAAGTAGASALATLLYSQPGDAEATFVVAALRRIGEPAVTLATYQIAYRIDGTCPLGVRVARLDVLVIIAPSLPNNSNSYWLFKRLLGVASRDRSRDRDAYLAAVIERLPAFGKRVAPAVAEMLSYVEMPEGPTRSRVLSILPSLGPEVMDAAITELRRVAEGAPKPGVAERQMSQGDSWDKFRVAALCELVRLGAADAYQSLRLASMNALAEIGPDAKAAVPQLLSLLRESSPVIRGSAAYALVRIAPEEQRLPGELVRAAKENDWMLCVVLSPSLRSTAGIAEAKVELTTLARHGPGSEVRAMAYYALRDLGVSVTWLYPEQRVGD
jgi:hypothetical protein